MFPSIRPFAWMAGGAVLMMVTAAVIGSFLDRAQAPAPAEDPAGTSRALLILMGVLFLTLGVAIVPLAIRLFTHLQAAIGNGELALVRFLRVHERVITYVVWGMIALSLLLNIRTVIRDFGTPGGPFRDDSSQSP